MVFKQYKGDYIYLTAQTKKEIDSAIENEMLIGGLELITRVHQGADYTAILRNTLHKSVIGDMPVREVEKIIEVEKTIEVPVEVIKEVEVPVEVPVEIEKIVEIPAQPVLQSKDIIENGEYTADIGYDGLDTVNVNIPETIREVEKIVEIPVEVEKIVEVPANPNLQDKTITENGEYNADEGYDGLGTINVNVQPTEVIREVEVPVEVPAQPKLHDIVITENGTYLPDSTFDGFSRIVVQTHVHTFSNDWTYDNEYHWHEPTCGHTDIVGNKERHNLPEEWSERLEEDKYTIKYKDCSVCDFEKIYGQEYEDLFDINYYGTISVKDKIDLPNEVVVPYTIRGVRVIELGIGCFENVTRMTSIELPDSIKEIMDSAFSQCYSLNSIDLPEGIRIRRGAFAGCGIKDFYLPDTFTFVNVDYNNPIFGGSYLETISVPKDFVIYREWIGNAPNFKKIIYRGTLEEWNTINEPHRNDSNYITSQYYLYKLRDKPVECLNGETTI